jgi:GNAT superfamily N-acetyltransferase
MSRTPQAVLIADDQIPSAGEVLAQAFFNDPLCVYTQPSREARMSQFTWLFTQLAREGALERGVYINARTDRPDGVAVWMPPQVGESTAEVAVWSEMNQMAERFGPEAYCRFTEAFRHFERVHHRCMVGPHWYLALLGVSPEYQRQGIGGALLTPVLQRADREGAACYLETFVADNVPFYERRGFQVLETGVEPKGVVAFWAMMRTPHGGGTTHQG